MDSGRIVIAGSKTEDLGKWAAWLEAAGFCPKQCDSPARLAAKVSEGCDILFLGLYAADAQDWLCIAAQFRNRFPFLRIAAVAVEGSEDLAIRALRARVDDYIREDALVDTARALSKFRSSEPAGRILGESLNVRNLRERLDRLAKVDCNVLITGESGTGKELAAVAIHSFSRRRSGRLVCVNCAALPESLVESELFGRERGAFTGAESSQDGKLKAAHGGIIFLDEIGDLSLHAQAKILRAVETKEIFRLGSNKPIAVDARIVAATHRDLEEMVRQGLFRQDLFFRLNVGRVHISPLRERIEDLRILIKHYLAASNRQMGTRVEGFSEEAWECLARYSWPGNIRELKNLVESLLVNACSSTISAEELPSQFRTQTAPAGEREELMDALLASNWNKSKAAEKLRWSRMKLYRKMTKYSVSV